MCSGQCSHSDTCSAFTWNIQLGVVAHRHIEVARPETIHEIPRALEPGRGRRGDRLEYRVGESDEGGGVVYRVLQPADLAVGSAELEAARRVQQVDDHALGQVGDAVLVDVLVQPRAQGVDLVDVEHDLLLEADLTRREAAGPLRVAAAQHARRVDRAVDVEGRRLTRAKSRHSVAHLRPEEGRRPLGASGSRGRGRERAGEGGRGRTMRANDGGLRGWRRTR